MLPNRTPEARAEYKTDALSGVLERVTYHNEENGYTVGWLAVKSWKVNHKRVYRIYCQEGLSLRLKHSAWCGFPAWLKYGKKLY